MVKIYKQPFAHGGDAIAIPDASQPDGKMSSADGWTPDYQLPKTDPNYKPVGRQEMNGVFKEVTEAVGELQQFGFAKWQAITWPQGARVVEGGVVYRALNQTSQQPPHADWVDELAIGAGSQSLAENGYQKLPSGLILQWGGGITNAGGGQVSTFPMTFPTAALAAVITGRVAASQFHVLSEPIQNNMLQVESYQSNTGAPAGNLGYYYFVIGF